MSPLRVVFLGSDPIALPLLNWLTGEGSSVASVVAVFTQPDKPVGRGQKIQPNEVKMWALERGLPVLQPEKLTPEARAQLVGFSPDVALVMAYGHILRDDFIHTPRFGTLNFHTSLLPKYRGASPIQTAVACGETETGVTLMRIVRKLDAGPIADVERVPIGSLDTALTVETKLAAACVPLIARALPRLADGSLAFAEQNDADATYCRKLVKEDGAIDFAAPARTVAARINGLFPWPACAIEINGQWVKIGLADRGDRGALTDVPPANAPQTCEPGTVLGADALGVLVQTGEGMVRLRRLQRPGGRMLEASEFLRGFSVQPGTRIASRPMSSLLVAK